MYYCLNENYLLRGWEKLQTGIVKKRSGQVFFLQPSFYSKIRNMRGLMFENSPFMTAEEHEYMALLIKEGIVYLSETDRKSVV